MQRILTTRFLTAGLLLAPVSVLFSQEITKPTTTTTTGGRLPAPAKITAKVNPTSIFVVWSAVEGAAKYTLVRSVANVSSGPVALRNPTDTFYIDGDLKGGNTYYYVVNAVDESSVNGMKVSSAPVKAINLGPATIETNVRSEYAGPPITLYLNTTTGFNPTDNYFMRGVTKKHWVSLNESVVTVQATTATGDVAIATPRAVGLAYILQSGMTADSTGVHTFVHRINVLPAP
jgi:hypothetical protein